MAIEAAHFAVFAISVTGEAGNPAPIVDIAALAGQRSIAAEGGEAATLGPQHHRRAGSAPGRADDIDRPAQRCRPVAQPVGALEHLHVADGERVYLLKLGGARCAADRHPVAQDGEAATLEAGLEARSADRDTAFALGAGVGEDAGGQFQHIANRLGEDVGKALILHQTGCAGDALELLAGGFGRRSGRGALQAGGDDDLVLSLADTLRLKRGESSSRCGKHGCAYESALHSIDLHDVSQFPSARACGVRRSAIDPALAGQ